MRLLGTVAVLAVMLAANLITNRWRGRWYVTTCLVSSVALLALAGSAGLTWSDLGLGANTWLSGIVWGAVGSLAVLLVYGIGVAIPRTRRFFAEERFGGIDAQHVLRHVLVVIPLGTVLLEELAFRGVLLSLGQQTQGTIVAVAETSIIFGLWHILPSVSIHESNAGVAEVLGSGARARTIAVAVTVLATAVAGVVFCVLRIASGSLLAPMMVHWTINSGGVILARLMSRPAAHVPPVT